MSEAIAVAPQHSFATFRFIAWVTILVLQICFCVQIVTEHRAEVKQREQIHKMLEGIGNGQ